MPPDKMGYYVGVFNFLFIIPQIVGGLLLKFLTKNYFEGHTVKILMLGGICMIIVGVLTLFVKDVAGKIKLVIPASR